MPRRIIHRALCAVPRFTTPRCGQTVSIAGDLETAKLELLQALSDPDQALPDLDGQRVLRRHLGIQARVISHFHAFRFLGLNGR